MGYKESFDITPPPPVNPETIKERVDTDVVVVGCGISGLTASLSAAEAGARTVALEKSSSFNRNHQAEQADIEPVTQVFAKA